MGIYPNRNYDPTRYLPVWQGLHGKLEAALTMPNDAVCFRPDRVGEKVASILLSGMYDPEAKHGLLFALSALNPGFHSLGGGGTLGTPTQLKLLEAGTKEVDQYRRLLFDLRTQRRETTTAFEKVSLGDFSETALAECEEGKQAIAEMDALEQIALGIRNFITVRANAAAAAMMITAEPVETYFCDNAWRTAHDLPVLVGAAAAFLIAGSSFLVWKNLGNKEDRVA